MTTYHRYVIFDADAITICDLQSHLQDYDSSYRISGDVIMVADSECGIGIDVTHRGDPVFDDDLDLVCRLAKRFSNSDEIIGRLKTSTCMVTVQTYSYSAKLVLECLWACLRQEKNGVLVFEGGTFE